MATPCDPARLIARPTRVAVGGRFVCGSWQNNSLVLAGLKAAQPTSKKPAQGGLIWRRVVGYACSVSSAITAKAAREMNPLRVSCFDSA